MDKPESFEVAEYGKPNELYGQLEVIKQIASEIGHRVPSAALRVAFTGNVLKVTYLTSEMHLPGRMKEIQAQAHEALSSFVKELKKEYKSRTKKALGLKEQKDKANYTVQKTSLNSRYYYLSWQCYEIS